MKAPRLALPLLVVVVTAWSALGSSLALSDATYSELQKSEVCAKRPELFACLIADACEESSQTEGWCDARSLLGAACADAPDATPECETYAAECRDAEKSKDSDAQRVKCGAHRLKTIPSTRNVEAFVRLMCEEMPGMRACKSATRASDPVGTYISLCSSMPGMSQCKSLIATCKEVESKYKKSGATAAVERLLACESVLHVDPPEMRMYLHASRRDYVVFHGWVPSSSGEMLFACLVVFALSVSSVWLRAQRVEWNEKQAKTLAAVAPASPPATHMSEENAIDASLTHHEAGASALHGHPRREAPGVFSTRGNAVRGVWALAISALDMFVMLVAMSFNLWLILAVVFGAGAGHFAWGHRLAGAQRNPDADSVGGSCAMCA